MPPDEFIAELWSYAQEIPTEQHPWFQGILQHRWTRRQIILGEVQHCLRVRTNPIFFGYIAVAVWAHECSVGEFHGGAIGFSNPRGHYAPVSR